MHVIFINDSIISFDSILYLCSAPTSTQPFVAQILGSNKERRAIKILFAVTFLFLILIIPFIVVGLIGLLKSPIAIWLYLF